MDRRELTEYIFENYGVEPDFPWADSPEYAVFRHPDNKKWFALIMNIPGSRIGVGDGGIIDIVNLKCDPMLSGPFYRERGVYPAYHMNKQHWLTVSLGEASRETLIMLLEMSYGLTAKKYIRAKKPRGESSEE